MVRFIRLRQNDARLVEKIIKGMNPAEIPEINPGEF
jgi:hypothetical protein